MSDDGQTVDSLSYDGIVEKLVEALRTKTGNANAEWNAATLLKDVGIASFDFVEYVFDIEEYFGIEIDLNANRSGQEMETLGDIATMIANKLKLKRAQ